MNPGDRVKLTGAAWHDHGLQGLVVTIDGHYDEQAIFTHHGIRYRIPLDYSATPITD